MVTIAAVMIACGLMSAVDGVVVAPVGSGEICGVSSDPGDFAVAVPGDSVPIPIGDGRLLHTEGTCEPELCWFVGGYRCTLAGGEVINVSLFECPEPPNAGDVWFGVWGSSMAPAGMDGGN